MRLSLKYHLLRPLLIFLVWFIPWIFVFFAGSSVLFLLDTLWMFSEDVLFVLSLALLMVSIVAIYEANRRWRLSAGLSPAQRASPGAGSV